MSIIACTVCNITFFCKAGVWALRNSLLRIRGVSLPAWDLWSRLWRWLPATEASPWDEGQLPLEACLSWGPAAAAGLAGRGRSWADGWLLPHSLWELLNHCYTDGISYSSSGSKNDMQMQNKKLAVAPRKVKGSSSAQAGAIQHSMFVCCLRTPQQLFPLF